MRVLQGMQNVSGYYGIYMWVLQGCNMPTVIMGLICEYCKDAKCQQLLWDLYVGIAMNAKCQWLF
jgi:hypothetical protein